MVRALAAVYCFLLVAGGSAARSAEGNDRAERLQRSLASQDSLRAADLASARRHLQDILSAPEFSETVHGPSAWEQLKRRIGLWLMRRLGGLFKAIQQHPATTELVFWVCGIGALGLIAFLIFQLFRREEQSAWRLTGAPAAPTRTASEWIEAARLASQRGDVNAGIQCLYWAAIAWLRNTGALPSTTTGLTPRELLAAAGTNGARTELRSLTSSLERFWYARAPATTADFAACLRHLEAMGCKLD